MRKINVLIWALGSLLLHLQANAQPDVNSRTWQKSWAQVQPGMWMQATEVTNAEFGAYLEFLQQQGNLDAFYMYYPDTTVWKSANGGNQPYVSYYFSHPSFASYPVVGISYEAAEAYCHWLTYHYSEQSTQPFGNIEFRLPTQKEWIQAAQGKQSGTVLYPWGNGGVRNKKGERLANFKDAEQPMERVAGGLNEKAFITAPVNSYSPNSIGLHNMSGNVAEMLQQKGQAAGGSYLDAATAITIQSLKNFDAPTADIGFRVLMIRK